MDDQVKEFSITEAKNQLPRLVHFAEKGAEVRITRRGRPVAVLVSEREFERLLDNQKPKKDLWTVIKEWRKDMIARCIPFPDDDTWENLRDRSPPPDRPLFE